MEIKIYCILHLKAIEFFLVTSFEFLFLLFLHIIEIPGILAFSVFVDIMAFPFSVFIDITDGDWISRSF